MEIRKTAMEDLDAALSLYARARQFMKENGNPSQWGDSHPPKSQVIEDIRRGHSYLCVEGGQTLGIFYYAKETEPTYAKIYGGAWLNDAPYGVMHRVAAPGAKKGVASFCVRWCLKESGGNIRIDTHKDNIPMQKMLEKNGFLQCGTIRLSDGSPRLAYQKTEPVS